MELRAALEEIEKLIQQRAEQLRQDSTHIKAVSRMEVISQLKNSEEEIMKHHKEAKKLWRKSLELYADFIKKNPGSKQVNPPADMPEEPKELDEIRGYVKLFKTYIGDQILLEQSFLREIFKATSEGITATKHNIYALSTAVSGLCATYTQ